MSTINNSSSLNPAVYTYTQQQASNSVASGASNSIASAVTAATESTSIGPITGAHHGHHHGGDGASGLQSQIQQAVTSALSDSDGDGDPNDVIQSAIDQVLQKPAGASSQPPQPGSATFEQFLQSQGVDMNQFKSDLSAAFQQSHNTGAAPDLSQAFSNLPPGSVIDASA